MNQTKKKVLIVALAACLLALVSVGTLAWFTAEDEVTNEFHVAGSDDNDPDKVFSVDVWERSEPQKDEKLEEIIFNDILPGDDLYKEVNIENTGSYDQYIRVTVTLTDASVWQDIFNTVYVPLNRIATDLNPDFVGYRVVYNADKDTLTYVLYYNAILPYENGDVVTLFTNVHIPEAMDRYQAAALSGNFDINVYAEAVQTEHVGDNAVQAFVTVGRGVESEEVTICETAVGLERILNNKDAWPRETLNDQLGLADNLMNAAGQDAKLDLTEGSVRLETGFIRNEGTLEVTGGKIEAGSAANYSNIAIGKDAVTTYNDVNIASAGGGVGAVDGAKVIFNGGQLSVNTSSTSGRYLFYTEGEGSEIVINGGDFADFTATSQNQKRAYVYAGAGTKVTINGGTFGKASTRSGYTAGILGAGTVEIKGGTFGFDPSAWVVDGYEAQYDATAKTWTVSPKA